jgi:hypothetical protein
MAYVFEDVVFEGLESVLCGEVQSFKDVVRYFRSGLELAIWYDPQGPALRHSRRATA